MFYLVKQKHLKNPMLRANLKGPETWEDNVACEVVRVDCWKAVDRRNPGHPWKHMKELYGKHGGQVMLLAGSGPSLKECPVEVNVPSIAVNRAIRHLKADYWCVTDLDAYEASKDHPNAKGATLVANIQLYPSLKDVPCYLIENAGDPWRWKVDKPLYYNETTTGWAIHLAMRMGASKLVMIGQDGAGRGCFDGFLQDGRDTNWQLNQHYGVMERMMSMFSPGERGKWDDRPMEVFDASGGYLPVKKVKLRDYVSAR